MINALHDGMVFLREIGPTFRFLHGLLRTVADWNYQ
jgi:hypothetical protein